MHPLLRLALCLQLLIVACHGYFVAEATAQVYPLGASARIDVLATPPTDDAAALFVRTAVEESIDVGRIRTTSSPQGPLQTVAVLPHSRLLDDAPVAQRLFGFALRTTVVAYSDGDEVAGRWVSFGSDAQTIAFAKALTGEGFTVDAVVIDAAQHLRSFLSDYPMLLIEASTVLAVFVAAVVSANRSTRVRAVHQLVGVRPASTVVREVGDVAVFAGGAALAAAALWAALAGVGWGGREALTGRGLLVIVPIVVGAGCGVVVAALGVVTTAVAVGPIVRQFAGARPVRLVAVVSTVALIGVIVGAFAGIDRVGGSTRELDASVQAQRLWAAEPDARAFTLAAVDESVVQELLPGWTRAVRSVASAGGVLLSATTAHCDLRPDGGPCLFVNGGYLERSPARLADGSPVHRATAGVAVLLPRSLSGMAETVQSSTREWLRFQSEQNAAMGEAVSPEDPSVSIGGSLAPGQYLPVYSSRYRPEGASVRDPLVVVLPDSAYSGDFALAAATSGQFVFFAPGETLAGLVSELGLGPLVFSIDRPTDLAAGVQREAQGALVRNAVSLAASLVLAVALVAVLTATQVERRRKPLFLSYLHGESFARRHVSHLLFLSGLVASAITVSIGLGFESSGAALSLRFGTGVVLVLAALPVLAVVERRFRADILTHP